MLLSIIIPTYNEQMTIKSLVDAVIAVDYPLDYEIILVDDASIDRTYEKQALIKMYRKNQKIRIFKNRINQGKGFSIRKGIRRARGEIIIVQDADREYSPSDIPRLLEPILNREAQVVYGSRFLDCPKPQGMVLANRFANRFLTWLTNLLYGTHLTDMETCYKVIKADLVKGLPLKANRFDFEPEVTALLSKQNVCIKELPICYDGRTAEMGKKIKAIDFLHAIFTLLRCRFNRR